MNVQTILIGLCGLLYTGQANAQHYIPRADRSDACTNFIVGKKASADGSVLISYNSDAWNYAGPMHHFPAGKHPKGTMRKFYNWEIGKNVEIPEAPETYNVIGYMNEHQVAIGETTFDGRKELFGQKGLIDYGTLMVLALQRSKTAREAIHVIDELTSRYGYSSTGESFSIADKNEVWLMEMIGKGKDDKGMVWAAIRIPDDCVSAHANTSRIQKLDLKDKSRCLYSKDVISFARKKGYFKGKDKDFDFSAAYCPLTFERQRFCDARVWSFFRKYDNAIDSFLPYIEGKTDKRLPLYIKPSRKISAAQLMNDLRDHYEGTPLDMTADLSAGPFQSPARMAPLQFEVDGKKYFHERPTATMQTSYTFVAQSRGWLPDPVGGVIWWGADDSGMSVYTPVYCCTQKSPECYSESTTDANKLNWKSAFWVYNWVANMVYPRWSLMINEFSAKQQATENAFFQRQPAIEKQAMSLPADSLRSFLSHYSDTTAVRATASWKAFGEYLIVRYNDNMVHEYKEGRFTGRTSKPNPPKRFLRQLIKATGDRYLVPDKKPSSSTKMY